MTRQSVRVEGLREVERNLLELRESMNLSRATAKNTVKRALKDAAKPVQDRAQQSAPKRSGKLAQSIEITDRLSTRQKARHFRESGVESFVGAQALPHAHLQEFGTAHHRAQPFLRPAFDTLKHVVLSRIVASFKKEIGKTVQRLQRKALKQAMKK